jgi:hypothetical protein
LLGRACFRLANKKAEAVKTRRKTEKTTKIVSKKKPKPPLK